MIYQQVLVKDDNGVNAIFNMLDYQYRFVGAELYMDVEPIRSHRDVFPIRYANNGCNDCFEFEAQYDQTATQRAANDPNDTHRIAATTKSVVHTLSERMQAMDGDYQLNNDEVLNDVGDE